MKRRRNLLLLTAALLAAASSFAQAPAPTPIPVPSAAAPSPSPSPPPSPVGGIRNKISAGDLPSAESVLEVYREQHGEDGPYLVGLAWLARGAWLLGDRERAKRYNDDARRICDERMAKGARPADDHDLEYALGSSIEVEAQRIEHLHGAKQAASYCSQELAKLPDDPALRSRVQKRMNLLTLVGTAAPELTAEGAADAAPPTLASMRGKPVVMFLWAEGCGDCRAQEAALARVMKRRSAEGVQLVTVTRYYQEPAQREAEKARVDSVWKAVYADLGTPPHLISTASMVRYGGSSTPTFVFIDRKGIVRDYTPTRLTEAELDRRIAAILK